MADPGASGDHLQRVESKSMLLLLPEEDAMGRNGILLYFCSKIATITTACTIAILVAALNGCGGGSAASNTGSNPTPTPTAKTAVQVNMGDSPADWMLAFP